MLSAEHEYFIMYMFNVCVLDTSINSNVQLMHLRDKTEII